MKYFFLGKIFLYELNSYRDAYLSKQLLLHAKGKKPFSKLNKRPQSLIETFPAVISPAHVAGLAYCEYMWNGFYDYMYAKLFRKLFGFMIKSELLVIDSLIKEQREKQNTLFAYTEFDNDKIILITPLIQLFRKNLFLIDWYFNRNNLNDLDYEKKDISLSMQHVQTQNIESNFELSRVIDSNEKSSNLKVILIRRASKELGDKPAFLKACSLTFRSASRWDRWFKNFLYIWF